MKFMICQDFFLKLITEMFWVAQSYGSQLGCQQRNRGFCNREAMTKLKLKALPVYFQTTPLFSLSGVGAGTKRASGSRYRMRDLAYSLERDLKSFVFCRLRNFSQYHAHIYAWLYIFFKIQRETETIYRGYSYLKTPGIVVYQTASIARSKASKPHSQRHSQTPCSRAAQP